MPSSDASLIVKAPIKLNLFLHINWRRTDGYHELQTYFQLLDYGDRLEFTVTERPGLEVVWQAGDEGISARPARPEQDLIHRAAMALLEQPGPSTGIRIHLTKNAPVGGGVGGGSAAAATTLLVLNRLWRRNLDRQTLGKIGRDLGADVPIFIHGKSCLADGIGERFTDLSAQQAWFVVVDPGESVSTAELFADPRLQRDLPKKTADELLPDWHNNGVNVFESLVLERSDKIRTCHAELHRLAGFARLTGTGGCLFAPVDSEQAGRDLAEKLSLPKRVMVCRALDQFDPVPSPAPQR